MTRDGIRYHKNRNSPDPCPICHDDGIVILLGTTNHHGYEYSRGSAPCHWCEAGTEAFATARTRRTGSSRERPESDYTIEDVDGYDPHPEYPTKAEARSYLAAIRPQLGTP